MKNIKTSIIEALNTIYAKHENNQLKPFLYCNIDDLDEIESEICWVISNVNDMSLDYSYGTINIDGIIVDILVSKKCTINEPKLIFIPHQYDYTLYKYTRYPVESE